MSEQPPRKGAGSPGRAGSLRYGLPLVLVVAALAAWGLQAWHDAEPDAASLPAGVLRREPTPARADELPLPPAALPELAREIESLPDGSDENLVAARRKAVVLEWWGVPVPDEARRQPCAVIVVDGQDRPVSGASIEPASGDRLGPLTDERGHYNFTPTHSQPTIVASLAGVGCSGDVNVWSRNDDQPRTILVPLQPELHLQGRVVSGDGEPCPDVPVYTYSRRTAPAKAHAQPAFGRLSDGQGRFAIDVHLADDFVVEAVRDELRSETVAITEELAQRELLLVFPSQAKAAVLKGTALSALGEPLVTPFVIFWEEGVAHANVPMDTRNFSLSRSGGRSFARAEGDDTGDLTAGTTGSGRAAGAFGLAVASSAKGWLTLGPVEAPIQAPRRVSAESSSRKEALVLRACAPALISGQVLDPQGKPISNGIVWTISHWPDDTPAALARAVPSDAAFGAARAMVDANGRFVLPGLHPDARFDIGFEGYEGRLTWRGLVTDVAAGSTGLRLVIGAEQWLTGAIRATITSARTGAVPEAVQIRMRRPHADALTPALEEARADFVSGVRRITGLHDGEACDLLVQAYGFGSVLVRDIVATSAGTPIAIALPEPGALQCTLSAGGEPLPWAVVMATPLDHPEFAHVPLGALSTRSDAAGHASFEGLDPGHWRIVVASGDLRARREVLIAPGETATESIELK